MEMLEAPGETLVLSLCPYLLAAPRMLTSTLVAGL